MNLLVQKTSPKIIKVFFFQDFEMVIFHKKEGLANFVSKVERKV